MIRANSFSGNTLALGLAAIQILVFSGFPFESRASAQQCGISDSCPVVIIQGCDTGVKNVSCDSNCTISDKIKECAIQAKNHGAFVSCVAKLTNNLKKRKLITGGEKGRIQSCAAKAAVPCGDCTDIIPDQRTYCFEYGTDQLSVALQDIHRAYVYFPQDAAEFEEINRLALIGRQYLQENGDEAAARLIQEASRFMDISPRKLEFIHAVLGDIDSPISADYFVSIAEKALPTTFDVGEEQEREYFILRQGAVAYLGKLCVRGNSFARQGILNLLTCEDKSLKEQAVRVFYGASGSRWRAQRTMKLFLAPEDEYLLYQIY